MEVTERQIFCLTQYVGLHKKSYRIKLVSKCMSKASLLVSVIGRPYKWYSTADNLELKIQDTVRLKDIRI